GARGGIAVAVDVRGVEDRDALGAGHLVDPLDVGDDGVHARTGERVAGTGPCVRQVDVDHGGPVAVSDAALESALVVDADAGLAGLFQHGGQAGFDVVRGLDRVSHGTLQLSSLGCSGSNPVAGVDTVAHITSRN